MIKEFVPYDCALALKELGFDEYSMGTFSKDTLVISIPVKRNSDFIGQSDLIVSPLYQQAFRWFREKHGLIGLPRRDPSINYNGWWFEIFEQKIKSDNPISLDDSDYINFDTYEEAELECLKQLIKVVKEKT